MDEKVQMSICRSPSNYKQREELLVTGKDLIIYILQNNLEDEVVLKDGFFIGFMDESEAAAKFSVGVWTIRAWFAIGALDGLQVGEKLYFFKNTPDPRKGEMTHEC